MRRGRGQYAPVLVVLSVAIRPDVMQCLLHHFGIHVAPLRILERRTLRLHNLTDNTQAMRARAHLSNCVLLQGWVQKNLQRAHRHEDSKTWLTDMQKTPGCRTLKGSYCNHDALEVGSCKVGNVRCRTSAWANFFLRAVGHTPRPAYLAFGLREHIRRPGKACAGRCARMEPATRKSGMPQACWRWTEILATTRKPLDGCRDANKKDRLLFSKQKLKKATVSFPMPQRVWAGFRHLTFWGGEIGANPRRERCSRYPRRGSDRSLSVGRGGSQWVRRWVLGRGGGSSRRPERQGNLR